jgi:hypothetical protein
MFGRLMSRVGSFAKRTVAGSGQVLRRLGDFGATAVRKVGAFVAENHHHLAPAIHGLAMASGNERAQRITGGLLAGSQFIKAHQDNVARYRREHG